MKLLKLALQLSIVSAAFKEFGSIAQDKLSQEIDENALYPYNDFDGSLSDINEQYAMDITNGTISGNESEIFDVINNSSYTEEDKKRILSTSGALPFEDTARNITVVGDFVTQYYYGFNGPTLNTVIRQLSLIDGTYVDDMVSPSYTGMQIVTDYKALPLNNAGSSMAAVVFTQRGGNVAAGGSGKSAIAALRLNSGSSSLTSPEFDFNGEAVSNGVFTVNTDPVDQDNPKIITTGNYGLSFLTTGNDATENILNVALSSDGTSAEIVETFPTPAPTVVLESTPAPSSVPVPAPTPAPTSGPVPAPSSVPVPAPTPAPTSGPVPAPSSIPSSVPVPAPSSIPSSVPVPAPSSGPSSVPSSGPSSVPVPAPSSGPSSGPSSVPSSVPVPAPSSVPVPAPSSIPSSVPVPTVVPTTSSAPVPNPSSVPVPAEVPTATSTPTTSVDPTPVPVQIPTSTPHPSQYPTPQPTHTPSAAPSADPSEQPTHSPTHDPTAAPSTRPSEQPTVSKTPTNDPTASPSASSLPTPSPTETNAPSQMPNPLPPPAPAANQAGIPVEGIAVVAGAVAALGVIGLGLNSLRKNPDDRLGDGFDDQEVGAGGGGSSEDSTLGENPLMNDNNSFQSARVPGASISNPKKITSLKDTSREGHNL